MKFNHILGALLICLFTASFVQAQQKKVLVFSKTKGFRHGSIPSGQVFFMELGKKYGFQVDTTENSNLFNEDNLKNYAAVVWLNTTADVLDVAQQVDFERYIQAGGGYMGVHAASDTEYNWGWYNDLMGGYFASHPGNPNVQNGKMITMDKKHPSTAHLPDEFERKDEFYDFKSLKSDILNFLIKVDEKSYKDGKMGDFHPLAWYHEFDGGKAFYTNYGHTNETFSEPLMMEHFWGGLKSVMAEKLDYSKAHSQRPPEENRFERTVLIKNLDEPTELAAMPNGKIIFTERKGLVRLYNTKTKTDKQVAKMPVYTKFEYGLMGIGIDPNFEKNNYVYLYYTPDSTREATKDNFLSRFIYDQERDTILMNTEKVMLRVFVKRDECCHTGGSIEWDKDGNLFLSTGDDTNPFASDGYSPHDFQADRSGWDGLRAPANTNDLRGKVLRITPQPDGTYTIPKGNLFPEGTEKTRPEIFVMGCRNPYRISVDQHTGHLYWGDVGPDAGKTNPDRGPEGIVEFNRTDKPGFFGWPMFTGNNFAYNQYDFATKTSGEKFNPLKPINNSPNNTGLTELPPTQPAWVWYGYGPSKEFPWVDKGGANPMAGPIYYSKDYSNYAKKFPSYFDGKFFAYEWMRDWIYTIGMDKDGKITGAERFMPNSVFAHPMDMTFANDGTLYTLDYGYLWFAGSEEAMLNHIEFNPGNRRPLVMMAADQKVGAQPFTVQFNTDGTKDYDGDNIKYAWDFAGGASNSNEANPKVTFTKAGEYNVKLTVTDAAGNHSEKEMTIKVGNAVPKMDIAIKGNKSFYFEDKPINYNVKVQDKEDGKIKKGIDPSDVIVSVNFLEGFDKTVIEQGHKSNTTFSQGKRLMDGSDCKSCHQPSLKSIGPSYIDISKKYRPSSQNIAVLTDKIIKGGGGVWGEQAMAAHPQISVQDARTMVQYILSLGDTKKQSKPIKNAFLPTEHKDKKAGAYLIQATYSDKGNDGISSNTVNELIVLRNPTLPAIQYDEMKKVMKYEVPGQGWISVMTETQSYVGFNNIDLTGIKAINVGASSMKGMTAGGEVEIRLGSPTGQLIGKASVSDDQKEAIRVPIKAPKGILNKIYFVAINPNAGQKPLFIFKSFEFLTK